MIYCPHLIPRVRKGTEGRWCPYAHKKQGYTLNMLKLLPLILLSLISLSGCGGDANNAETVKSEFMLSQEDQSILKFCAIVDEAYTASIRDGMSYETRDIFSKAYDVIHEEFPHPWSSSRYRDYDTVMAHHSWNYGPYANINDVIDILDWCEPTKDLIMEKIPK